MKQHSGRHIFDAPIAAVCAVVLCLVLLPAVAFADGNKVNTNQLPDSSFLYDTDLAELAQADSYHDKQTVQVRGEVVGDRISDEVNGDECWISLQDDDELNPVTVPILMTKEQAEVIDHYGRYGVRGTTLQVRGTYYLDCVDHQGLSDIHAEEVSVVTPGKDDPLAVNPVVLSAGVLSVLLGGVLLVVYYRWRERMR